WLPAARKQAAGAANSPPAIALDPTRVGDEVFFDPILAQRTENARLESPLALRLIEVVQRVSDNPVAVKELRARLRGKLHSQVVRNLGVMFAILTVLLLALPAVAQGFGIFLATILFGPALSRTAELSADVLACWYSGMLWTSVSVGLGILPLVFAPEREKATLGFLLISPMRARSIVLGKAVGLLIP